MAKQHSCGYYSGEAFIEIEHIRAFAEKNNAESVDSHLTLLEKEIDNVSLHCGIINLEGEKQHLGNIRTALTNKQLDKIPLETYQFEKKLLSQLARGHNDGGDPLDVIPTRVWDAINK